MNQVYLDTVRLLIDIAPAIFQSPRFAMKGGTAINLFMQDMPRLSVDIDIVFIDHSASRDDALAAIDAALNEAGQVLQKRGLNVRRPRGASGDDVKMFVGSDRAEVKVDVNHVFRGTLLAPERAALSPKAQDVFASGLELPLLNPAEIYGSKLVAAMDRQHPRDIFDVMMMREKFGLDARFVDCFVAYLAGHGRPIHEVLFSSDAPQFESLYENYFRGMTLDEVPLDALLKARAELKAQLPRALTSNHRDFLLSLVRLEPAWDLMPLNNLSELPALKWKLANLANLKKTNAGKFKAQSEILSERLGDIS